ncbi:hypothetical protein PLESTF_000255400 [Pleodorina starrii]|nr:hypothetical protein PLESTF_000255400 [Pleodorina starrii]
MPTTTIPTHITWDFKIGTGDVVGAALDFQRKQIFFTRGAKVSVNFGQSPFVFDIEPYKIMVGSRVAIRNVSIDEAQSIQADRGEWDPSMETMLGKTGTVVEVLGNGAATVLLDDGGGTKLWSPLLLVPAV